MPLVMRGYFSSHVGQAGYDPENRELHVEWQNGKRSVYSDVPPEAANNVLNSASIGEALHSNIRGVYDHGYLE